MIEAGLNHLASVMSSSLQGDDAVVRGVAIDSRKLLPGQLFFAFSGAHCDGHDYLQQAQAAGAVAAVVERPVSSELPQIVVDSSRLALGQLAAWWRQKLSATVVALTGSNGKTTVKEMLAAILARAGDAAATVGNLNNALGMPLTLLSTPIDSRYLVLEMGANHIGEIAYLTQIAKPDVALITNAGPAHLEGFGDLAGVAKGKGEIYAGLTSSGCAVINADDVYAEYWHGCCSGRKVLTYALDHSADVTGSWHALSRQLNIRSGYRTELNLPLLGRHNARNALAAATVALALDIDAADVVSGLEAVKPSPGRLNLKAAQAGFMVIDDSYNANPASVLAAVEVMVEICASSQRRPWMALGDLDELGTNSEALHIKLGQQLKERGVQRVFAFGAKAAFAANVFADNGYVFQSLPALSAAIEGTVDDDVVLLVKGSRSSQMERVVEQLCREDKPCC